jgi:hypothetical protein
VCVCTRACVFCVCCARDQRDIHCLISQVSLSLTLSPPHTHIHTHLSLCPPPPPTHTPSPSLPLSLSLALSRARSLSPTRVCVCVCVFVFFFLGALTQVCSHLQLGLDRDTSIRVYVCVDRIRAPHTTICVLILLYVSSYYYVCVLILLCVCPHTPLHVSAYYSTNAVFRTCSWV